MGVWVSGHYGVTGGVRSVLEAGRDCRYSGARRGIGGIRGHWGLLGGAGGHFGGIRSVGVSGCIGVASGLGA